MKPWLTSFFLIFVLLEGSLQASPTARTAPIGIIVAIKEYEEALLQQFESRHTQAVAERNFHVGTWAGQDVVLVRSPMGKIGVAVTATVLLMRYAPKALISVAPAGSLDSSLGEGTLLIGESVAEYDVGSWSDLGVQWPKMRHVRTDAGLIAQSRSAAKALAFPYRVGIIASGDAFIASPRKALDIKVHTQAIAVDTSSAAVTRVGAWTHTPVLLLRMITDHANKRASMRFDQNAHDQVAMKGLVRVLREVVRQWR